MVSVWGCHEGLVPLGKLFQAIIGSARCKLMLVASHRVGLGIFRPNAGRKTVLLESGIG